MTIGIDLRIVGNSQGGIGRYALEITRALLLLQPEHNFVLFYNAKTMAADDLQILSGRQNVRLVETQARHYSLAEQTSFYRLLSKQNLDLMHFPNFNVPLLYNKPFVVTIHDMVHHKISGAKKTHALHFYAYKKVIEHAAKAAKKIITVSAYSKTDIINYLGVPAEKIEVIYEGISAHTQASEERVREIKNQYLLHKPYFMFVGVLERKKNLVNLTRGFDLFLTKYKLGMDLVVVGKIDKHYPEIKHHAMDIAHKNNLVFTGHVSDQELAALYSGAYAYVNASAYEGFGLPGVEAMAFGLPLAVSNIETFNEIYDNAAVYFNPDDLEDIAEKMHLLARDKQFYEQRQRNSLARAAEFDWRKAAYETLLVYQEALA